MKNFVTSDLRTDEKMNHAGGQGPMYIKHLLGKEELNDKCGLYAEVTIPAVPLWATTNTSATAKPTMFSRGMHFTTTTVRSGKSVRAKSPSRLTVLNTA